MSRTSRLPRSARRGMAGMEFALTVPLLVSLTLCTADVVLWLRTWLRVEQSASELGQIVTRYPSLYTSDFTGTFFPIAKNSVGGTSLTCTGAANSPVNGMVVTGISNVNGAAKVGWQWSSGSCVTSAYTSGATATLPGGYVPPSGLSVILVELFAGQPSYVFSASTTQAISLSAIRTYAVVMPRNGTLPTLTNGTRPAS